MLSTTVDDDGAVAVFGEVDNTTAPDLERVLLDAIDGTRGDVVVDLGGVTFMDSSGVNILVRCFKRLEPDGRALVVRQPTRAVRLVLDACGMDAVLRIE